MDYNICVIQPDGSIHSAAFAELAELVAAGLRDLGHSVLISHNHVARDARNVIIGCHLLAPSWIAQVPKESIVINTEQLSDDPADWNGNIHEWIKSFETWDYSERNFSKLMTLGAKAPKLLRIGFHNSLARIPKAAEQDIDVLFYGSIGDRRRKIIEDLWKAGCKAHAVFGVYGESRDQLISRAKVVLNMHHYDAHIFEVVRVFYLMTNAKAIVAEVGERTSVDSCYLGGVRAVPYEGLVEACLALAADEKARLELEVKAFQTIGKLPQCDLIRPLLA